MFNFSPINSKVSSHQTIEPRKIGSSRANNYKSLKSKSLFDKELSNLFVTGKSAKKSCFDR